MLTEFSVPVDDLLPEVRTSKTIQRPDNLEEVLPNLVKEVESRPWLQAFFEDVRRGDKKAVFRLAVGSIIIVGAVGAGYELGVTHGRDVKNLINLLERHRNPKKI